ncbi:MAG: hypothetical protein IJH07_06825 [Ruminococcus sp.]|nr:hypothetical protein [Ruminococcus sp.]
MKSNIKSIIIKVTIAFVVVVVLLTYFSGTIENYLLPHVSITFGGEGTLKHDLKTVSVLEPYASAESYDSEAMCFRFTCSKELEQFVRIGSTVDVMASVEAARDEYVYRSGVGVVVRTKETEEGVECTAELKRMELKDGEQMPAVGETVVIDTVFESAQYGHVVMKSAIQDGSYVYLVTKDKDDKRYISKVPVTVVAESDFYAAVEMDAESLPFVLSSTKAIHDGQRVIVDG